MTNNTLRTSFIILMGYLLLYALPLPSKLLGLGLFAVLLMGSVDDFKQETHERG